MLNAHRVESAPLWARALLESAAIAGTTLACFSVIPAIRSLVRPDLNYLPLPFAEPFLVHLQVAILIGLVGLAIRLFVSKRRSILYGFLIPFAAMLLWAFDRQNLFVNPDLWKLLERGWFTAALLAGLAGLLLMICVHNLFSRFHILARLLGLIAIVAAGIWIADRQSPATALSIEPVGVMDKTDPLMYSSVVEAHAATLKGWITVCGAVDRKGLVPKG